MSANSGRGRASPNATAAAGKMVTQLASSPVAPIDGLRHWRLLALFGEVLLTSSIVCTEFGCKIRYIGKSITVDGSRDLGHR